MRGLVVNPEATRAQFEGAGGIRHQRGAKRRDYGDEAGAIDQSNFQDYPVARIMERRPIRRTMYIVDSDAPPAGVGEPGAAAVYSGVL